MKGWKEEYRDGRLEEETCEVKDRGVEEEFGGGEGLGVGDMEEESDEVKDDVKEGWKMNKDGAAWGDERRVRRVKGLRNGGMEDETEGVQGGEMEEE